MKYVVTLVKKSYKTVIVDAENDEEADRKLLANDVEREYERIATKDCYDGWEYESHLALNPDELITSADDVAREFGCKDASELERALYKYTECGMCADWDDEKITLVGYVEGVDCDGPSETLYFPFAKSVLEKTIACLEEQADEMWREWNYEDYEDYDE